MIRQQTARVRRDKRKHGTVQTSEEPRKQETVTRGEVKKKVKMGLMAKGLLRVKNIKTRVGYNSRQRRRGVTGRNGQSQENEEEENFLCSKRSEQEMIEINLKARDRANEDLFTVLFMGTTGAAASIENQLKLRGSGIFDVAAV